MVFKPIFNSLKNKKMATTTSIDLVTRAEVIKNETAEGQNTATRVGSWLRDSWDTLQTQIGGFVSNTALGTLLANYIPLSQKGAVNGVAPLGADGKVPVENLPYDFYFKQEGTTTVTLANNSAFALLPFQKRTIKANTIKKGDVFYCNFYFSMVANSMFGVSPSYLIGINSLVFSPSSFNNNINQFRLEILNIGGINNVKVSYLNTSNELFISVDLSVDLVIDIRKGLDSRLSTAFFTDIQFYKKNIFQVWGNISGSITNQTDLQTALDAKSSATQTMGLQTQINAINTLLNSNDVDLDNVQELVDAIKTLQTSLATILVNNLTAGGTTKALTAEQGKILKTLVDGKQNALVNISDSEKRLKNGLTTTLDFGERVLLDSNSQSMAPPSDEGYYETVLDWVAKKMYAFDGPNTNVSIDWQNRQLKDSNGSVKFNWETQTIALPLADYDSIPAVIINDTNDIPILIADQRTLLSSNTRVFDFQDCKLNMSIGSIAGQNGFTIRLQNMSEPESSVNGGGMQCGTIFVKNGALKYKGANGTVTTIAPA
ncbi:MAG: hypothetical protein EAZ27_04465 [Cytophagales bacterium]|nr:MAG: hypothetical protein EAZ27_04465 [Cytophagales bacterium]